MLHRCIALCLVTIFAGCGQGSSIAPPVPTPTPTPVPLITRISSDPFGNASSQHRTEVEPSAIAFGSTIVAAFQAGRFFSAGSSDIDFATSRDGGTTWTSGSLPFTTAFAVPAGPFDSVSDPVAAYDGAHGAWLISSIPIFFTTALTPAVLVSRSTDGLNWSAPANIAPGQMSTDKDWIACDDAPASPKYGTCYVQWDDPLANGLIHMSRSSDGGLTWSAAQNTAGNGTGIGGVVLVQPNGTVIVPINDFNLLNVLSFVSHDGGATWSSPVLVSPIIDHFVAGGFRSGPLLSAAVDATGRVYAAWQDCRFRAGCLANDIVISTSADGIAWSAPARVPIDGLASGVDHFIPGLAIDPMTGGAGAHLNLTYYYYANANCTAATCQLYVGNIASTDGGNTWTAPVTLAGPMSLAWLANTSQGPMVGDYVASVFSNRAAVDVFAAAFAPTGGLFDEAMYVPKFGVLRSAARMRRSSLGERPIAGITSDHPERPRLPPPIR